MDQNDPEFVSYNVATLNYSFSIVSPYEFHEHNKHDNSLFEFQLDEAFKTIALKQFPNFNEPGFDWGMSAMDLVWKNRFSPFYRVDCGIGAHGKMMKQQEFIDQWNKQCNQAKTKIIEEGVQRLIIKGTKLSKPQIADYLEKQILACRTFDLIGYKAFIKVLYEKDDIKNLDVSSQKYRTQREKHFNKAYLKKNIKKQRTIHMIQSRGFDIFCLQQCSKTVVAHLKEHLKNYIVVQMPDKLAQICDSIILLKKSKFPGYTAQIIQQERAKFLKDFSEMIKNPKSFSKQFSVDTVNYLSQKAEQHKDFDAQNSQKKIHEQLFWNKDTCYAILGSLIVFSPHISTKQSMNTEQINHIKATITKILTYFPQKHFICAGDLNGQFENQLNFQTSDKKYIKVNAFPYHNQDITCYKMRTITQAQRSKALAISFCKKDYIITDLRINEQAVLMSDGTQITKANASLIPNQRHPFDHFIVSASLRMIDRIQSCSPLRRKKPVSSPFQGFTLDFAPDTNA